MQLSDLSGSSGGWRLLKHELLTFTKSTAIPVPTTKPLRIIECAHLKTATLSGRRSGFASGEFGDAEEHSEIYLSKIKILIFLRSRAHQRRWEKSLFNPRGVKATSLTYACGLDDKTLFLPVRGNQFFGKLIAMVIEGKHLF
jgi:hypothetical protein